MKKRILKIVILMIFILIINTTIFASTLNLSINSDKDELNVGEKVKITVFWDKGMQAADFSLKYDEELLEFVKTDLKDIYINDKPGDVKIAWFSDNDEDKNKVEYIFKAKKTGEAKFFTKINGGFATGELEIPENYKNDEITLKIEKGLGLINIVTIISAIIILFIIFIIIKKNKINKKRKIHRNANKR